MKAPLLMVAVERQPDGHFTAIVVTHYAQGRPQGTHVYRCKSVRSRDAAKMKATDLLREHVEQIEWVDL